MSSGEFNARYLGKGFTSLGVGPVIVKKNNLGLLAYLNTKPYKHLYHIMFGNTSTFETGVYAKLKVGFVPIPLNLEDQNVKSISKQNINIAKNDWDFYETSWDFKKHPILTYKEDAQTIEETFNNWSEFAEKQFYQLNENEEELNRIFIEIYGLEDELTPEVEEKDVTVRKADRERDIKSFISYAVGCMLGRYSLDEEGLVFAGGEFDKARYESFKVDSDGILPVLDDEYFDDDILARFIEFLKITFGEENLVENIDYIAETLGRRARETSRQTIYMNYRKR